MAYFDIQVNGYAGVDFNQDDLQAEDLHRACQALRRDGTNGILATIITEEPKRMAARIRRLVTLRQQDTLACQIIRGIHVEGPFLNPQNGYRGAHPDDAICTADPSIAGLLLEAGDGLVRLFTLAPETDGNQRVIRLLKENGVTVAAGHTDASIHQLKAAIDAGLTMVTHLGNGCPLSLPRHDNIIQRVLYLRGHLWLCFIADGVHIPFFALQNYLDLAGDRAMVTTDAMAAAGLGPGRHRIGRWEAIVNVDLAAWAPDGKHLLGSAMSMPQAARNLSEKLNLCPQRIQQLTSSTPRISLGERS